MILCLKMAYTTFGSLFTSATLNVSILTGIANALNFGR